MFEFNLVPTASNTRAPSTRSLVTSRGHFMHWTFRNAKWIDCETTDRFCNWREKRIESHFRWWRRWKRWRYNSETDGRLQQKTIEIYWIDWSIRHWITEFFLLLLLLHSLPVNCSSVRSPHMHTFALFLYFPSDFLFLSDSEVTQSRFGCDSQIEIEDIRNIFESREEEEL